MNRISHKGKPRVRLRAFRAIDDAETCDLFIKGHQDVLSNFGIKKITSAPEVWPNDPAVFVLIVESPDKKKVFGGLRIHIAGGTEPLPIEQATGRMDRHIYELVGRYAMNGTGEGCGLWNSAGIAGYGLGSVFLTRAGLAIAPWIGLTSLFALCTPYTLKLSEALGYRIEKRLGNNGTFYYPKLDLTTTAMIYEDLVNLSSATEEHRNAVLALRAQPTLVTVEAFKKKEIEIHYDLNIPGLASWNINDVISYSGKTSLSGKTDESNLNLL